MADPQTRFSGDLRVRTRDDCESACPWPIRRWSWPLQTTEFVRDEHAPESRALSACCLAVRFLDARFYWKQRAGALPNEWRRQKSQEHRRCRWRARVGPVVQKAP